MFVVLLTGGSFWMGVEVAGEEVALNQEKEAWSLLLLKFKLFLKEKHLRKYAWALCVALSAFVKVDLGDFLCETNKAA